MWIRAWILIFMDLRLMMIDLCVVSYNAKDKLKRLIDGLNDSVTREGFTLNVQDNNSEDGSLEYLTSIFLTKEPKIDSLISTDNIGYSAACNYLASEGEGDIIGLLNCDVWLDSYDIDEIQVFFDDNPEVAIMGPKQRDENGHITHAGIFGTNDRPRHRGWKTPDPNDQFHRDTIEATTISGSAYFVRRSVWDELTNDEEYQLVFKNAAINAANVLQIDPSYYLDAPGAFLPTPHYFEETFCSYYARHRGYKVFYNGKISIGHSWHASSEIGGPMDGMFKVSQAIFRKACDDLGILHD